MANEAFALSPISARAASPTDADFEAIREAFLETARGRWFLDEYTRRNRNADTAMVLEAVARIENSLAAQKEEQRQQAAASPDTPSSELPDAMAAVRAIIGDARASAATALAGPVLEDALAPSRKCARVIREIVWGLRESGADGRICALLGSQVDAINAACDHVAAGGLGDGILQIFDQAAQRIDGILPPATSPRPESVSASDIVDLRPAPEARVADTQSAAIDGEAVVALEVASPETAIELPVESAVALAEAAAAVDAIMIEPVMAQPEATPAVMPETIHEIRSEPATAASVPTSLGASLIASGIIARPISPRSDPLAPIRRMSQAEKIAFFS